MGMDTGMEQWLVWGGAGFAALLVLIGMGTWLRRNKKNNIVGGSNTMTDGDNGMTSHSATIITDVNGKTTSWGFFPWALISFLVLGALGWVVWTTSLASGAQAIKLILWTLLGLAGLFSLLGLAQMTRRHPLVDEKRGRPRGLGFITLISGLVLGLASWFVWQPKVADLSGLQVQVDKYVSSTKLLKTENTRLTGLLAAKSKVEEEAARLKKLANRAKANNSVLTSENSRLKGLVSSSKANGDEINRLKGVVASLTKTNSEKDTENTRLNGLLSNNNTDGNEVARLNGVIARLTKTNTDITVENNRVKGLIGTYKNDNQVLSAKIEALKAEISKLSKTSAPIGKGRTTPLDLINKYNQNETKLHLTSDDYNMIKLGRIELVNGKPGSYYNIILRNPTNGKDYQFESASYSKLTKERQFKQSLDRAISDIRGALEGKRNFQVYVEGKASARRYKGKLVNGFKYSDVKVMENKGGSFGPALVARHYGPKITNADLPNLRGAFLQAFLVKNYKINKPIILEGKVSKSKDVSEQAVAIMLFVES